MNGPLVSIIIPVYNAAVGLAKCIETARRQTYENIELLLVNDGSADSSPHICRMYARVDARGGPPLLFFLQKTTRGWSPPLPPPPPAPRGAIISSLSIPTIIWPQTPPSSWCARPKACGATL